MLQLHELLPAEVHRCRTHLDNVYVLYPDSKLSVGVITWFVGDHHSRDQLHFVVLQALSNALWPFVDIQERTDAVGCAVSRISNEQPFDVPVVKTVRPQGPASENVPDISDARERITYKTKPVVP